MITFLVSIALFHFYNFIINKDDISSKIVNYKDKILNFDADILKVRDGLSELTQQVNGKIVAIRDINIHRTLTNLHKSVKDECKKSFE